MRDLIPHMLFYITILSKKYSRSCIILCFQCIWHNKITLSSIDKRDITHYNDRENIKSLAKINLIFNI